MFKKLIAKILPVPATIDPAAFNDPVAAETCWTPLVKGGSNFKTNQLHRIGETRWEFRASGSMKLFCALFLTIGLIALVMVPLNKTPSMDKDFLGLMAFGAVFAIAGGALLYVASIPAVFDKGYGYYCKNRKKPEHMMDPSRLKNHVTLSRIHALQIVAELCRDDKTHYTSYELNLVLNDATRMNIVDHGNLEALREDARSLAEFLGVPLWDAA